MQGILEHVPLNIRGVGPAEKTGRRRLGRGSGRTLVALALAAAIPVLLLSGWVATVMAQQQRDLTRHAAVISAARVAERVAADIAMQMAALEVQAAATSLDQPDFTIFYAEAERLKRAHPLWETIELSGADGIQVVNLLRALTDGLGPTADRKSFDEVMRTRRPTVGGIGPVGPISGKRLVALRVPVIRGAAFPYVLSIGLATKAVSAILRNACAPEGWVGTIVDADGNTIARTRAEAEELGHPADAALLAAIRRAPQGFYMGSALEGSDVEVVYRTLKDTGGWSVHFSVPAAKLDAPVARSYYVLAGGSVLSVGLALALVGLVGRDMAQRRSGEQAQFALALRSSEEQGAVAAEAAELGTLRWDTARGRVTGSARAAHLLGWKAGVTGLRETETDAHDALSAISVDDRQRLAEALRGSLADGTTLDVEFRVNRSGSEPNWVRLTGRTPVLDADTSTSLFYGVVSDIEPRKRAEADHAELLRKLNEAQEDEQRRIARELHDQVGQTVTGLSLGLKNLEGLLKSSSPPPQALEQLHWLQTIAGEIGRDIHHAAVDLRPTALDDLGLREALGTLLRDWSERHGIRSDLQFIGDSVRLPTRIETAIYRIVQEALTNVLKHAQASDVSVSVERRPEQVRVIIEDDGVGFDTDACPVGSPEGSGPKPRLGLSGIRERLSLLNGKLTLESSPGSGAALFVYIPLSRPA